jgi:putative peptidoglycan lipid II flippase
VTSAATDRGTAEQGGRGARGIGRPALMIGVITAVANVIGFGRQLVFAHTVGANDLGTAYATANQVPNIIYAIVLGGALTGMVVPVLAGPALARDKAQTRQISSALLTWTLLLLVPVSLAVALAAQPVVSLLIGHPHVPGGTAAAMRTAGAQMLVVFAPQIVLYGLAVVGYGILQAHRRFAAPALAPILSSVVVAAAYFAFVPLAHGHQHQVLGLPRSAELMLSAGTTAGVVALAVTALAPVRRLRLRLRPTLRFPSGVAARVRALAIAGVAALVAQNISTAVVIVLANAHGPPGALVLYNYGWQAFFVPYAVLAVPIATSAFPVLSASAAGQSEPGQADVQEATATATGAGAGASGDAFDTAVASSTRAAMLAAWLGAALLIGACVPAARVFLSHADDRGPAGQLAWTLAAFAPGLAGFGLAASLSRVLFACRRTRIAAIVVAGGWLLVIAADLVIVPLVASSWVVPALGLGNTIGLTVAGVVLLGAVRRARGPAALSGVARAGLAGVLAAAAGAAAGAGVSAALRVYGFVPNVGIVLLACAATVLAFGLVVLALDGGEVRALAALATAKLTRKKAAA